MEHVVPKPNRKRGRPSNKERAEQEQREQNDKNEKRESLNKAFNFARNFSGVMSQRRACKAAGIRWSTYHYRKKILADKGDDFHLSKMIFSEEEESKSPK